MKLGIYARVSDDKLKEDGQRRQDVNRQVDKLSHFAKQSGWAVSKIYIDDGKSAFTEDLNSRPAFKEMIRDAKANWIDRILIEDMTRFSRKLSIGLQNLEEISKAGCTITSVQEGELDVTVNEGWARTSLALFFAEWNSRNLADKVKSGMNRRLNDSRYICKACGIVHLGRHPKTCNCTKCKRKGGKS